LDNVVDLGLDGSRRCFICGWGRPDGAIGVDIAVIGPGQRVDEVIPECRGLRWRQVVRSSDARQSPHGLIS
jgi:hypothetical protein